MQHRGTLDIHTIFLRKPQYGTRKFRLQIIRTIPEISLGCPHMGCIRHWILPSLGKSENGRPCSIFTEIIISSYLFVFFSEMVSSSIMIEASDHLLSEIIISL